MSHTIHLVRSRSVSRSGQHTQGLLSLSCMCGVTRGRAACAACAAWRRVWRDLQERIKARAAAGELTA